MKMFLIILKRWIEIERVEPFQFMTHHYYPHKIQLNMKSMQNICSVLICKNKPPPQFMHFLEMPDCNSQIINP